jgi:hypothetical protein
MRKVALGVAVALAAAMAAPVWAQDVDNEAVVAVCVPGGDRPIESAEDARRIVACANREAARQMNAQTPIRVDELTTLTGVEASGTHLVYVSRIDLDAATLDSGAPARMEQSTRAYVCQQEDMRNTMSLGGSYGYRWTDRSGQKIHEIRIDRCP